MTELNELDSQLFARNCLAMMAHWSILEFTDFLQTVLKRDILCCLRDLR